MKFLNDYSIYIFTFFLILILYTKYNNFNKENILKYINDNIYDYKFRNDIINLTRPRVGEIVENLTNPWCGLLGYVTRINENNTFNIKLTKSLNPNNRIPKRVITKPNQDVKLC